MRLDEETSRCDHCDKRCGNNSYCSWRCEVLEQLSHWRQAERRQLQQEKTVMPPSSKSTREFDVAFLTAILEGNDVPVMERTYLEKHRWSADYSLTFKYEGKFWQTTYNVGFGDEPQQPWFGLSKVTCIQVVPKLITTTTYEVYQAP